MRIIPLRARSWSQPVGLIGLMLVTVKRVRAGGAAADGKKWEKALGSLLL